MIIPPFEGVMLIKFQDRIELVPVWYRVIKRKRVTHYGLSQQKKSCRSQFFLPLGPLCSAQEFVLAVPYSNPSRTSAYFYFRQ